MGAWWTIGKYGIKLNLGKFYRHRKITYPIVILFYIVYSFVIWWFVDSNSQNFVVKLFLDKVMFSVLIDFFLLYFFIYLIFIHIFTGIRRQNKYSLELLLSTPIRSGDIVLGETIAMLPIYLFFLPIVLVPILILGYYGAGASLWSLALITISQIEVFIVAIGIGATILALLQSSIQRIKMNRYFRLIAAFSGALIYISIYSLRMWLGTAQSITQNEVFALLPTSLSGKVIYATILDTKTFHGVFASIGFLALWIVVVYAVGVRVAGKAYSLEREIASGHVVIRKESRLLKLVRVITPPSQKEKVVTHFKVFFRDSHNFANSIYMIIIAYFLTIFSMWGLRSEIRGVIQIYTMQVAIAPFFVAIFLISMFYLSRDALWIWKKAPGGLNDFLKTKWIQTFILSFVFLPIPFLAGAIMGSEKVPVAYMFTTAIWLLLLNAFATSFGIFINVINPTKSRRGAKIAINSLVSTFALLLIIFVSIDLLLKVGIVADEITPYNHLFGGLALGGILNLGGFFMLQFSKIRIEKIMN
ncbi:MAG: hypothetical protein ACXQTP_01055 [Candidatus Methanofastidiosia archaeon]